MITNLFVYQSVNVFQFSLDCLLYFKVFTCNHNNVLQILIIDSLKFLLPKLSEYLLKIDTIVLFLVQFVVEGLLKFLQMMISFELVVKPVIILLRNLILGIKRILMEGHIFGM